MVAFQNITETPAPNWVLLCVVFTDAGQQVIRWQAGSVVLPIPISGQQIQWRANLSLSLSSTGVVNIPNSLTVAGVAVQRIPHVSCRVFGTTVLNSVGRFTPAISSGASGYRTITFSEHPAGVNFTPMATLTDVGRIVVAPPTVANSVQVITYNTADTASSITFYLLIF